MIHMGGDRVSVADPDDPCLGKNAQIGRSEHDHARYRGPRRTLGPICSRTTRPIVTGSDGPFGTGGLIRGQSETEAAKRR